MGMEQDRVFNYHMELERRRHELASLVARLSGDGPAPAGALDDLLTRAVLLHGPRTREYWVWYREHEELIVRLGGEPFDPATLPDRHPL